MSTPLSADRLVKALKDEGLRVVEYRSWRTHNRNHKGAWGPVHGVMIHHTVTSGTQRSVDICYDGYSGLPGPLCLGVIAKDGTVYLVGYGRANHAGLGDDDVLRAVIAERALPPPNENNTDGNARFYGFECVNLGDGEDPWPSAQLTAIERASAAICRAHGWTERSVIGHKEWTNTKIDPRGFSMGGMRTRVGKRLAPAPAPTQEDDMPKTIEVSGSADLRYTSGRWHRLEFRPESKVILTGPCLYDVHVNVYLDKVPPGRQVQGRFLHVGADADDGPIAEPTPGSLGKTFPQWSKLGQLATGETLQFEVLVWGDPGEAPFEFATTWRYAEGLYWPVT